MDWQRIMGNWDKIKGQAKTKWGKLTDDELTTIAGKRDVLIGKLRERYGMERDKAEREVDSWGASLQ